MRIGSLLKNKNTQSIGIVVAYGLDYDTVCIYWLRSGKVRKWKYNSEYLEVLCK